MATAIVAAGLRRLWSLGCGDEGATTGAAETQPAVLADTTFLADIARNVAGDRLTVASLLPVGADPHSFEPTPRDARKIAESRVVVINIDGLEPLVDELIASAGSPDLLVVEAAAGLPARVPQPGEAVFAGHDGVDNGDEVAEVDPHFWLDPVDVVALRGEHPERSFGHRPGGGRAYEAQRRGVRGALRELDAWIAAQVEKIPAERRLLVTNHESFGYFADRYGFEIVGTVFPTGGAEGSPSAQQLAALVEEIRATGAPAIFLETGSNADLAAAGGREAGWRWSPTSTRIRWGRTLPPTWT